MCKAAWSVAHRRIWRSRGGHGLGSRTAKADEKPRRITRYATQKMKRSVCATGDTEVSPGHDGKATVSGKTSEMALRCSGSAGRVKHRYATLIITRVAQNSRNKGTSGASRTHNKEMVRGERVLYMESRDGASRLETNSGEGDRTQEENEQIGWGNRHSQVREMIGESPRWCERLERSSNEERNAVHVAAGE
ncbi:hypothetical protein TRVL_07153 [Trypanosoma vivax]|nr:hypothetical protein TRVL_07153 [Trypanosoma vivax]